MLIAFAGIFLYGLLAALPGSVLPSLERSQFLPNDSAIGTFLLINAVGAVLAYLVSGPLIDRIGKKFNFRITGKGRYSIIFKTNWNGIVANQLMTSDLHTCCQS